MVSKQIKEVFIKYLKDKKHRITNERFLILDAAVNMKNHFDADELYIKMRKEYLRVSRATVYNTLELMSDCKILTKHNFKDDRARYETKYGRSNHYHIICRSCNKIFEAEDNKIEKILTKSCSEQNLTLTDVSLQVFADCNDPNNCKNCHFVKAKKR